MIRIALCDDEKKYLDASATLLSEYATAGNTRFSVEQFENPSDFLDNNIIASLASLKGDKGDKGDTGEQGPQGEKGDKGDTGEQGPQGEKKKRLF